MTESRILSLVLVLSGIGLGALAAHVVGVTSWLDAKLYMAAGGAGGVAARVLVEKLFW
jgi:hypothetical protein